MIPLKQAKFGKEGEIYGLLFREPIKSSRSRQRNDWKYNGVPFFDPAITRFWRLYCTPPGKRLEEVLPFEAEVSERESFIKNPVVVMVDKAVSTHTARGGIWIEDSYQTPEGSEAHFHLRVEDNARRYAYPLLEFFIEGLKERYSVFSTAWDKRPEEHDPSKFFMNNGFQVREAPNGEGRAILRLNERPLINRIPIISQIDH